MQVLALDTAVINVKYDGGHIFDFNVNRGTLEGFPGYGDDGLTALRVSLAAIQSSASGKVVECDDRPRAGEKTA